MITNAVATFNKMASTYDADFTMSGIGRLQRERVWCYLNNFLAAEGRPLRILEINCGTGEDALRLADLGHDVIATDASGFMIKCAAEKASTLHPRGSVIFVTCSFDELASHFANEKFDLVFSNFGGLNCIDTNALKNISHDLAKLLQPQGHLLFVVMSNCCLREIFYYAIRAKMRTAFRRLHGVSTFGAGNNIMTVFYYSPKGFRKIFCQHFSFEQQHPVGLFIPPSYLEKRYANTSRSLEKLNRLEKKWDYPAMARFADHYCIVFKKANP